MNKLNIRGEDLKAIGYPEGKAIGMAIRIMDQNYRELNREDVLSVLTKVVQYPENFLDDEVLCSLAQALIEKPEEKEEFVTIPLKEVGDAYSIFGAENIEQGAINQMEVAMKLPVTVAGALMPDAHQGYGLPIGGVLATKNAVIPYGVGVDIGCRMALSIYDITENHFLENEAKYKRELIAWTKFGAGAGWQGKYRAEHGILDRSELI